MIKKYQVPLLMGGIFILFITAFLLNLNERVVAVEFDGFNEETLQTSNAYIYVDIKGEVKKPGVYKLKEDTRLFQLVDLAGGFTDDADQTKVNLSLTLYDELLVMVPALNDDAKTSHNGLVSINEADKTLLITLPNIGASTAQKIIEYREANGPFKALEDLMQVSGIGETTFENLRPFITL
jgi:competence protein ComEA